MKKITICMSMLLVVLLALTGCSSKSSTPTGGEVDIPEVKLEAVGNALSEDFTIDDVKLWVGKGEKRAVLIIQWNDGKQPDALAWGYRFDEEVTAFEMIQAITREDDRLTLLTHETGPMGNTIAGFGYDLNNSGDDYVIYDAEGEEPQYPDGDGCVYTDAYDYDDWLYSDAEDHWGAAWYKGFWQFYHKFPGKTEWGFSQLGASSLKIDEDNTWLQFNLTTF